MVQLTPEAVARHDREPIPLDELKEWMSEQEKQAGNQLVEIIPGTDLDHAIAVLRKHSGDVEKAVDDLLNAAVADPVDRERDVSIASIKEQLGHIFNAPAPQPPDRSVIDLTSGDDLSLDAHTRFRATTRSPDPGFRSTQAMDVDSKSADDELNQVIQASYHDFAADDSETIPPEDMLAREGGRPIAIRTDKVEQAYATLVVQALFHVPQVRQRCSKLRLYTDSGEKPTNNPEWAIWEIIEMFTSLDLSDVALLMDINLLSALRTQSLKQTDRVGKVSKDFLELIVELLQTDLNEQHVESGLSRLFHFTYCHVRTLSSGPPQTSLEADLGHVVSLDIVPDAPGNDLVTRLAQTLNVYHPDGSSEHQLIREPSELVTFELNVLSNSSTGATPEPFTFPKSIYMDQFLAANLDLANETRLMQLQFQLDIDALVERKRAITRSEDRDALDDIRGIIEYCESTAQCDTPERLESLRTMSTKLKTVLGNLEREVQEIDERVTNLQGELDAFADNPELQCHPYDLRAVLVHTGLPGRKHIYSYVQDKGTWWKTVDYTVTEVSEDTVLTDPAGLHLGAGPYMLMYSRRQTEEEESEPVRWPTFFIERVQQINRQFHEAQAATAAPPAVEEDEMDLS